MTASPVADLSPSPALSARQDLARRWEVLSTESPRLHLRDAAVLLGVSEVELLATRLGTTARLLAPRWERLWSGLRSVGRLKTMTRNAAAVLEKWGVLEHLELSESIGQVVGADLDYRFFPSCWASLFHVREHGRDGERESLQIFDACGDSVTKVYREPEADPEAFSVLVAELARDAPHELPPLAPETRTEELPDDAIDVQRLRKEWDAMEDTHEFFGLLRRHRAQRTQALRLAGYPRARLLQPSVTGRLLHGAAALSLPIMVFVGNRGALQIHTGPIRTVRQLDGWLNVLDPGTNLHLREELVAEAWLVQKPTRDDLVTSIELFDARGDVIALFFGKRKPGQLEDAAWRDLVLALEQAS